MNANEFYAQIGIKQEQSSKKNLEHLQHWFAKHLSRDKHYPGDEQEQLVQYRKIIETYLVHIAPKLHHDLSKANPQFAGDSTFYTLAAMGMDRLLSSLSPDKSLVNAANQYGLTPLHRAALDGHVNTVNVLLALGADQRILNKQQQSPLFSTLIVPVLHEAQLIDHKITIFHLLKAHAPLQLSHQDNSGNTLLHLLATHEFTLLMDELLTTNPELSYIKNNQAHYPIHTAILNEQIENVRLLLTINNAAILADGKGEVALHYAARYSSDELLALCCQASTNRDIMDHQGCTPLHLAAAAGRLSAIQILITHGANIELMDHQGATILHHAVQSNDLETVGWLLHNTAVDVQAKNQHQQTAQDLSQQTEMSTLFSFIKQ